MTEFISRYGADYDGGPRACPHGMYPWDVDYPGEDNEYATLEELKAAAHHDSLNLPISWYFAPEHEGGEFELVYVMPRKCGRTWSQKLAPGFDRAEVEAWLETWTKQIAAKHYGWADQ